MNNATRRARQLADRLRCLDTRELAAVTGGRELASTSTSGTPEAGDDTVGDTLGGGGPFVITFSGRLD